MFVSGYSCFEVLQLVIMFHVLPCPNLDLPLASPMAKQLTGLGQWRSAEIGSFSGR